MKDNLNLLLIIAIGALIVAYFFFKMTQARKEVKEREIMKSAIKKEEYTSEALSEYMAKKFMEMTTSKSFNKSQSKIEYQRAKNRQKDIKNAWKRSNTGDISARTFILKIAEDLLVQDKKINETSIEYSIPFLSPMDLTAQQKFEILIYAYQKKHGENALGTFIEKYELDKPKSDGGFRILENEIEAAYKIEQKKLNLTFNDKISILTQQLFSSIKGFGVIDTIREMNIDGVSGGVSGMPERLVQTKQVDKEFEKFVKDFGTCSVLESVWVMYKGKKIHFSFLAFKSQAELRRVTTNLYKYGYPGQLSESRPAIINELADGSRVTVLRPKLSESYAFFVRKKYVGKHFEFEELYPHQNGHLVAKLLEFCMKSNRTLGLAGGMGSGKTTALISIIKHIRASLSIRVLETKFELNLRNYFPHRNIVSVQETETYDGQDALDLLKKTDGDVTVLGEIASNPVASWFIQLANVGSLFTVFTHHAPTLKKLVFALTKSLVSEGVYSNERVAEQEVVKVLEFYVHFHLDTITGERVVERVSECVPIIHNSTYENFDEYANLKTKEEKEEFLTKVQSLYFLQQTQTQQFEENVIVRHIDGKYVPVNPISEERMNDMMMHLTTEEKEEFKQLMAEWKAVA